MQFGVKASEAPVANELGNLFSRGSIYRGAAGDRHLGAIHQQSSKYLDLERQAFPEDLVNPALQPYAPTAEAGASRSVVRTEGSNRNARYGPCE